MKKQMQRLIRDIEREVEYTRSYIGKERLDPAVMRAMASVPREKFVPKNYRFAAYDNGPLPIGHGQTISQPYIVALMTDLLEMEPEHTVLEIGTGCGYQSAVLSLLCKRVFTIELIPELGAAASARFDNMGYNNITARVGNGYEGWPEHAPYDGIIVTAAAPYIPDALVEQLKPGSRLVIPIGLPYSYQELMVIQKDHEGELHSRSILGVSFVPLRESNIESL